MIKTKFVLNVVHQNFVVVIIRSIRTMKLSSLFMMMILTMMIRTMTTITGTIVTTVAVAPVVVAPVMMIGTITWMINPSN